MTELARHTRAVQEALSTQISAIEDNYAELAARTASVSRNRSTRGERFDRNIGK